MEQTKDVCISFSIQQASTITARKDGETLEFLKIPVRKGTAYEGWTFLWLKDRVKISRHNPNGRYFFAKPERKVKLRLYSSPEDEKRSEVLDEKIITAAELAELMRWKKEEEPKDGIQADGDH